MENILIRLSILSLLGFLGYQTVRELRKPDVETYKTRHEPELRAQGVLTEDQRMTEQHIPAGATSNTILVLTYIIVLAVGIGFVVVKWVLPILGDAVGTATFSSSEQLEADPNAHAISLMSQGRYEESLAEFHRLMEERPTDRYPVMESVKLQLGKLHDVDGAVQTLRVALEQEWPMEDATFFAQRLADLYYDDKRDSASARQIMEQLIADYPNTPAAGHATHRLREIEEAEFLAARTHQG